MIRFFITTTISKRDSHGNCYNFSKIVSKKTGRGLELYSGLGSDGGNAKKLLLRAGLNWNEFSYTELVVSGTEFDRIQKLMPDIIREHEIKNETILDLEADVSNEMQALIDEDINKIIESCRDQFGVSSQKVNKAIENSISI